MFVAPSLPIPSYIPLSQNDELSVDICIVFIGLIASSQNLAYTLSKFLGGLTADKVSSKLLFALGLSLSGVITAAFTGNLVISSYMS